MELYLDNYKGFVDAIIPIKDVNFFVGENSTGKTAVLNLLEIVTSAYFWVEPDFNQEGIDLGYFSEMVSQFGNDKRSFSIGVYMDEDASQSPYNGYVWLKFMERDSSPAISEFRFICGLKSVWCYVEGKRKIVIKTKEINDGYSFTDWIHDVEGYHDFKSIE